MVMMGNRQVVENKMGPTEVAVGGWLYKLFQFLREILPCLHITVRFVRPYDIRNIAVALKPWPGGWEAELEVCNRARRITIVEVTLLVSGRTLSPDSFSSPDWTFHDGDGRTMTLHFVDRSPELDATTYELRIRDSFGKTRVKKGAIAPPIG